MPDTPPRPLLSPENIAMIDKGISAIVASCNAAGRPSLMRAVGTGISPDGTRVTVFVSRSPGNCCRTWPRPRASRWCSANR
jgi:hypothetical protein